MSLGSVAESHRDAARRILSRERAHLPSRRQLKGFRLLVLLTVAFFLVTMSNVAGLFQEVTIVLYWALGPILAVLVGLNVRPLWRMRDLQTRLQTAGLDLVLSALPQRRLRIYRWLTRAAFAAMFLGTLWVLLEMFRLPEPKPVDLALRPLLVPALLACLSIPSAMNAWLRLDRLKSLESGTADDDLSARSWQRLAVLERLQTLREAQQQVHGPEATSYSVRQSHEVLALRKELDVGLQVALEKRLLSLAQSAAEIDAGASSHSVSANGTSLDLDIDVSHEGREVHVRGLRLRSASADDESPR